MKKLAIITTHPIQYYAPVFKLLAKHLDVLVFYTWGQQVLEKKYDPGFKRDIEWDIPLLNDYKYHFTLNTAINPGSHHKSGIINPNLIDEIKNFHPDALLVYGYAYESHLKVLKYFKGKIPIYFRGDSTVLDPSNILKKIAKAIYLRWVYSFVDFAFYVGKANKEYFKNYGIKENQLIFAPHAVDNNRFEENRTEEAAAIRSKYGIKKQDVLILFAGKFEAKKNPQILINAFNKIKKENVFLLMLGNGVQEEALKEKVRKLRKRKFIFFEDFKNQSEIPAYYQACDMFCLPSKGPGETWGLAVNEAMAAGKAVLISNRVGCAKNLIIEGANGFVFNYNKPKHLYENLKLMVFDLNNLIRMGSISQNMIKNYTFDIQAQNMIDAIQ
jgi:glycosyltransferase involved in cell wall biosynthesis